MTMQIAMVGTDGIVLASDTLWASTVGIRTTESSSKVRVSDDGGVAISFARNMEASVVFADRVVTEMDGEKWNNNTRHHVEEIARAVLSGAGERTDIMCLIVSTIPELRLFHIDSRANLPGNPNTTYCRQVFDKAVSGDTANPAVFWSEKFYSRERSVDELIPLAAQVVVDSPMFNSGYIGGLELLICSHDGIRRVPDDHAEALKRGAIMRREAVSKTFDLTQDIVADADKFNALLRQMIATSPTPQAEIKSPRKKRKTRKSPA